MPIEVTEENFESEVLKSDMPVLVDFGAKWCGPCRKLTPVLDEISENMSDKIKVVKIDADKNKELMKRCSVSGLPTILIFKEGDSVERMVGLISKSTIVSNLEKHI